MDKGSQGAIGTNAPTACNRLTYAARGTAALLIAATLLPFLKSRHWAIRAFDFPRLQLAFGAALYCAATLARARRQTSHKSNHQLRHLSSLNPLPQLSQLPPADRSLLCLTAAALATQLLQIRPYTRFARKEVLAATGPADLTLITANVLKQNRRTDIYRRLFADLQPDLILLTEPDHWWAEQFAYLKSTYPHVVECPLENTYGMILYSRLPLLDPQLRFLVKDQIPSIKTRVRLRDRRTLWLYAVHPEPPASLKPDHNPRGSGPRDVELLLLAEELEQLREPAIVVGDFNDVAWSHTTRLFKRLSRLLDPRRGRGMFNTFHANYPPLRYPLDHLFHSEHMTLVDFQRLPYTGSDHFPIYAALQLTPAAAATQEQDPPSHSDEKEADHVITKADTE